MIVPDKKMEAYLNQPACIKNIIQLCRTGILLPVDFLRAVALCRSEKKWLRGGQYVLSWLAGVSFLAAAFFFVVEKWHFFYTLHGGLFLALLFVVCSFARRFAVADYVGAVVIGAMIFLPGLIFGTNTFLYEQFFLWFLLLIFWALPSPRAIVRLLPLVVLNMAVALYGIQFVLPTLRLGADSFCALAALLNLALLILREEFAGNRLLFQSQAFRFVPLLFTGLFLLAGAAAQSFLNYGSLAFLYCFIFTVGLGGFYLFMHFDRPVCRFLLVFSVLWVSLLICCGIRALTLPASQEQALFLSAGSLLIVMTLIIDRQFDILLKDTQDVG